MQAPEAYQDRATGRLMDKRRVLIVDDSPDIVEMLADYLGGQGNTILKAYTAGEALPVLSGGFWGVVILDFKLPDMDGLDLLGKITEAAPDTRVIMITGHGSIGMAVEAIQNRGAFYVHSKGEDSFVERLAGTVGNAFKDLDLTRKLRTITDSMGSKYSLSKIVAQSRRMQLIFRAIEDVMDSKVSVLIQGESGTGKELIARAIHYNGPRREEPFVAINCAGIPDTLLESELFGYEKGAFTGAYARKIGKFEMANKGTLFLDEIAEMNLPLQAKILRVLQEKSFERLGGNEVIHVDVRIISATNRNPEQEVAKGAFREDLYYRLAVFPVQLPPLRERPEDIAILAQHFLDKFNAEERKEIKGFTQRAQDRLFAFRYPGNVRQLENIVSHAVVVCKGNRIDLPDLPSYLRPAGDLLDAPASPAGPAANGQFPFPQVGIMPLDKLERLAISSAVEACGGNISMAARLLGISRATMYRKMDDEKTGEAK
jgi:DNA-binding NtrC family response regulator